MALSILFQDTFRGRVCECPVVRGVKFVGDGYNHCEGIAESIIARIVGRFYFHSSVCLFNIGFNV